MLRSLIDSSTSATTAGKIKQYGLSILIFLILAGCSLGLYKYQSAREMQSIRHMLDENTATIQFALKLHLKERLSALKRMAERWSAANGTPREIWKIDAQNYIDTLPGLKALELVDSNSHLHWVMTRKGIQLNSQFNEILRTMYTQAIKKNQHTVTLPYKFPQGYSDFITLYPVKSHGVLNGYLVGIFDIKELFTEALSYFSNQHFTLSLSYKGIKYFSSNHPEVQTNKQWTTYKKLTLFDKQWDLTVEPKQAIIKMYGSFFPITLLISGLLFSFLVALIVHYLLLAQSRAQALTTSNHLINTILQSTSHMIVATDVNGVITSFNKAAEKALGYSSEELIGKKTPEIWHDRLEVNARAITLAQELRTPITPGFDVFVAKAQRGLTETLEWTLIRKDGSRFPVRLTPTALKDKSQIIGYLGVLEDISEHKKTENEIRELRCAMENAIEGVAKLDRSGCYYYVNETYASMAGYKPEELIGKHWDITVHPEDKAFLMEEYNRMLKVGKVSPEARGVRKDGSVFYKQLTMISNIDDKGSPIGHFCFMKDISNRKQQEQEMELMTEKLLDSNTELERFAYIASHDLQEPIRMITSFGEIIAQDYMDVFDDEGKKYLKIIINAGNRMRDMISDLLSYSRLDNDDESMRVFKGESIVCAVQENLKTLLDTNKVKFTHDKLPELYGNPVQIQRLMQNIVVNGIKYQPEGNTPEIHVSAKENAEQWCISIQDNGLGIKQEFINEIFQPFKRLHTWDSISGTGLGLAICKKIAENHGGNFVVQSELGKGSTFSFFISKQPKHKGN